VKSKVSEHKDEFRTIPVDSVIGDELAQPSSLPVMSEVSHQHSKIVTASTVEDDKQYSKILTLLQTMRVSPIDFPTVAVVGYVSTFISSALEFFRRSSPLPESVVQSVMLSLGFWHGFEGAAGALAMAIFLKSIARLPLSMRFPAFLASLFLVFVFSSLAWAIPTAITTPTMLEPGMIAMFVDSAVKIPGTNGLTGALIASLYLCIRTKLSIVHHREEQPKIVTQRL
jgi:hypothetical protein